MNFENFINKLNIKATTLRRDILQILWQSSTPLKAYDILDQLKSFRTNPKPPTVYRVLDFLASNGIVHRLDNIQSYVLCSNYAERHEVAKQLIMLCQTCNQSMETSNLEMQALIQSLAKKADFSLNTQILELTGQCKKCAASNTSHAII
jgi:Fur family zinc uptake transcriptional regulator